MIDLPSSSKSQVLLDFDGPICSLFSSFRPAQVAAEFQRRLDLQGMPYSTEPFDILRFAAQRDETTATQAETILADLECEAADTAAATSGAGRLVQHYAHLGRPVIVVSNNSSRAVLRYIDRVGLTAAVRGICAREVADPELLKPSPHLIEHAINEYSLDRDECILVGDSTTDIEAAHRARISAVAFANKPGKDAELRKYEPKHVISTLEELLMVVT